MTCTEHTQLGNMSICMYEVYNEKLSTLSRSLREFHDVEKCLQVVHVDN